MYVNTAAFYEALARVGISQAELARRLNTDPSVISHFVTKGTARPQTVQKIAAALDIPFESLVVQPERKPLRRKKEQP